MPPLFLIDGSAYLFRAYHALPHFTNSQGFPTGAILGVLNMLKKLKEDFKPQRILLVFDAKGPTFRHELHAQYKAHRTAMPEDLAQQIEPLHQLIRLLGFPLFLQSGVEADDVIGTLAQRHADLGEEVVIISSDKDLAQMLGPLIRILDPMKNIEINDTYLIEKWGISSGKIIDFLALTGDTSDNIPGIPGVGPKTASKWLAEYGSLDEIVKNKDQITGKVGEALRLHLEQLPLAQDLARIRRDVALPDLPPFQIQEAQHAALLPLFKEYALKSWIASTEQALSKASYEDKNPAFTTSSHLHAKDTRDHQNKTRQGRDDPLQADAAPSFEGGSLPAQTVLASLRNSRSENPLQTSKADQPHSHAHHQNKALEHSPTQSPIKNPHYHLISDRPSLKKFMTLLKGQAYFALDTETNGLNALQADLIGLSFSFKAGEAYFIPLQNHALTLGFQWIQEVKEALDPILKDALIGKIAHHAKFDLKVLHHAGFEVQGLFFDTLLAAYILQSQGRNTLQALAARELGQAGLSFEDVIGKGRNKIAIEDADLDTLCRYACEDADFTWQIYEILDQKLAQNKQSLSIFRTLEMPLCEVLVAMEEYGVLIDCTVLNDLSQTWSLRLQEISEIIFKEVGLSFNLNSPKQLAHILFEKLNLPIMGKTPKGEPSTNEASLQDLALLHPIPKLLLEHRHLSKLKNTYADTLPQLADPITHRIHTQYQQAVVATGRLSSTEPNLQNIPFKTTEGKKIRAAIIAPPGFLLISADYSQIELRIMAHLSQDKNLLRAFQSGGDIHRATAAEVLGLKEEAVSPEQRNQAKAVNFGLIYGMSAFGLAKQLGITRKEANAYIQRYFERYPGVLAYMEKTRALAHEQAYVETVLGRRLSLPQIHSANRMERNGAERAAINAPMQGTAADLIKKAMIDFSSWLKARPDIQAHLIMQVHDELVVEVKLEQSEEVSRELKRIMETAWNLSVPLLVEISVGQSW